MKNKDDKKIELPESSFETFKKEFMLWVDIFGLRGWRINFVFEELDSAYAYCKTNIVGRAATISLGKTLSQYDFDHFDLKRTAFHECGELLLSRIRALANYRNTTEDEISEEIHNLIRIMEYVRENAYDIKKKINPPVPDCSVEKNCQNCGREWGEAYCGTKCVDLSSWIPQE